MRFLRPPVPARFSIEVAGLRRGRPGCGRQAAAEPTGRRPGQDRRFRLDGAGRRSGSNPEGPGHPPGRCRPCAVGSRCQTGPYPDLRAAACAGNLPEEDRIIRRTDRSPGKSAPPGCPRWRPAAGGRLPGSAGPAPKQSGFAPPSPAHGMSLPARPYRPVPAGWWWPAGYRKAAGVRASERCLPGRSAAG